MKANVPLGREVLKKFLTLNLFHFFFADFFQMERPDLTKNYTFTPLRHDYSIPSVSLIFEMQIWPAQSNSTSNPSRKNSKVEEAVLFIVSAEISTITQKKQ